MSCRELNGLEVGNKGLSLVEPCVTAYGAVPVLNVALGGAGVSNSCYVLDGVIESGKHNCLDVGSEAAFGLYPITSGAVPVLDVTELEAGGLLSLYVCESVSCGKDAAEASDVVLALCIGEVAITACAVPVINVTFGGAGGSYSCGLGELVSVVNSGLNFAASASALLNVIAINDLNGLPCGPVVLRAVSSCRSDNYHSRNAENECEKNGYKLSHF